MFDRSHWMSLTASGRARTAVRSLALAALLTAGLPPRAMAGSASSPAAAAGDGQAFPGEEEPYAPVQPTFGKSLAPAGALAPEAPQDGATVYMNETGPFAASPPLSTDPRMLGEQLTLTANPPAPLELRSVEFAIAVQTTTPLLVRVRVWDSYDAAASPVNSGLLRSEDFSFGTVPANPTGQFYPGVKVIFSSPIALADPGIFIELKFLTGTSGSYAPVQAIFALNTGGPQVGASTNDFFRDVAPGDGAFAPTERRQFGASSCSPNPPGCQSNLLLHLRGAPNPNLLDPGIDLWQTPGGGATRQVFTPESPIPAGLFNMCGTAGRTSDPLAPTIVYAGLPLTTSPAGILGATDSIVRRNAAANIPSPGASATIPIELVALSLVSTSPITITWNGGTHPELWDVRAALSSLPQPTGTMTVTRSLCAGEGGTFTSSLPVLPTLIFTRRADACTATLDAGVAGLPPLALTTTDGHWYPSAPAALGLVEEPYGGVAVDGNGDGTFDASLLPSTTNFHPGVRVPRCGCCQRQPAACSFPLMPAQCLASGGSFVPGADCGPSGSCEPSCAPAGPAQMRMTIGSGPAATSGVLPTTTSQADADGDLVPDIGDNCAPPSHPGVVNGLQEDLDGDGVGDACDNCPSLCSLGQEDTDLDGAGDACDCAPFDATVKARPGRLGGLTVQRALPSGTITVAWSSLDATAGPATQYDAVRGSVGALYGSGYPGGAVCALGNAPDTPYVEPDAACSAGAADGCWYLVRAANLCGTGTYADAGQAPPHPLDTASPCP